MIYPQSLANPPFNRIGQNYDEDSIMHFPGGADAAKPFIGHRKVVLGTVTDPSKGFKKNTKPSTTDVARANAMYASQENQKRDIGKDCRSGARLTRTYSAPAQITSAFTMTAAPIDITGTPRISVGVTETGAGGDNTDLLPSPKTTPNSFIATDVPPPTPTTTTQSNNPTTLKSV